MPLIRPVSLSPNVHGIVGLQSQSESDCTHQIHLHRTGYVGLALKVAKHRKLRGLDDPDSKILTDAFKGIFKDFFMLCKDVTDQSGVLSPYQVRCIFVNSAGAVYYYPWSGGPGGYCTSPIIWKRSRLKIAAVTVDSFKDTDSIVDLFSVRLRNSLAWSRQIKSPEFIVSMIRSHLSSYGHDRGVFPRATVIRKGKHRLCAPECPTPSAQPKTLDARLLPAWQSQRIRLI